MTFIYAQVLFFLHMLFMPLFHYFSSLILMTGMIRQPSTVLDLIRQ